MKQFVAYILICMLTLVYSQNALAQQNNKIITGTIYTQTGEPLAGATVRLLENPAVKAFSKIDGAFKIAAEVGQHLEIEFNGEHLKNVAINQDDISVTINNTQGIPIGYGRTRNPNAMTAAVGFISKEELTQQNIILNSENLLYGRIPGLMVLSETGKGTEPPGVQFLVRGVGSFRGSAPLILVDGFEYTTLRTLAPQVIESVSVLKDAAALAIYGQKGANGVILIETKRGGNHPMQASASFAQTVTKPIGLPNMLGAAKYAGALNEALINDGLSKRYSPKEIQAFKSGNLPYMYPNVDWFDEALRSYGTQSNFSTSFSGGGNTVQYYSHLSYGHYAGIFSEPAKPVGYKTQQKYGELSFRSNLNINFSEDLLLRFNVGAYMSNSNVPSEGTTTNDIFDPIYQTPSAAHPVRLADGTWGGTQIYPSNPLAKMYATGFGDLNTRQYEITANLNQDLDSWLEGLDAKLMVHIVDFGSYIDGKNKNYQYGFISPVRNQAGEIVDKIVTKYGEDNELDYSTSFDDQERHSALAGMVNYSTAWGDDKLDAMILVQQSTSDYDNINNVHHYRKVAGNVHYTLNDTYFFGVAASYAGRNLLPKGKRFYFFPAVSAGWLLSNEDFLQNVEFIDRLKLRASWGIAGHDDIPNDKPFLRGYSYATGYYFGENNTEQAGTNEDYLPAIDFGISRSKIANVGIEIGLFDHLDITTNLFRAKRVNILTGTSGLYSDVVGITTPLQTNGVVVNQGIEASLRWQDVIGEVAYSISGQLTYAKNEIIEMNEEFRPYPYLKRTGRPVDQWFGLEAIGFFENQQDIARSPEQKFSEVQPGDIKYKDQNGDGVINQLDEVSIGYTPYPEIYYSMKLGLRYKNFSFSALFQGVGHMTTYLNTESVYWPLRGDNTISRYYYNRRWTPNTAGTATLPRLTTQNNDNNFRRNSTWLQDQSYLKLRYVQLSYSLPVSLVQTLRLDHVELVATGRNLFSIDNIPVGDAESFDSGYPLLRYYSLGINVDF